MRAVMIEALGTRVDRRHVSGESDEAGDRYHLKGDIDR